LYLKKPFSTWSIFSYENNGAGTTFELVVNPFLNLGSATVRNRFPIVVGNWVVSLDDSDIPHL